MRWFSIDRDRNPYLGQLAAWLDRRIGEPPRSPGAPSSGPGQDRKARVSRARAIEVRPLGVARATIDERRTIDLHFVTCAEYQRFLDAMREEGAGAPPDHWSSDHFAAGQDEEPALGVRGDDARRFAQWMSRQHPGSTVYRLPSPEEATAYPAQDDAPVATWCEVGGRLVLAGLSPDRERELLDRMHAAFDAAPPRALAFDAVRIFDLARDRDLDVDLALVVALALAHELVSAERPIGLDLGLDLAKALGASVHGIVERASAGEITLALANARARARELDLDRDRTLAVALRPVLAIIRAAQRGGGCRPSASEARAKREHTMRLIERAFAAIEARAPRVPAHDQAAARALLQELHAWLRLVAARKDGTMPAWEGIRLVRERPFVEPRARARRPRSPLDAASSGG